MVKRSVLLLFVLLLCCTRALAQEKTGKEAPAPDVKAYQEASKIKESAEQLKALRKFIVEFPGSKSVISARYDVLDLLVKEFPANKEEILEEANAIEAADTWVGVHYELGGTLMGAGYLPEAEEMVRKGTTIDLPTYKKKLLEAEPKSKASETEIESRFKTHQGRVQATLGQILIKAGKIDEGESLLKEAMASGFSLSPAQAFALASVAEKRGDESAALDYMLKGAISGQLKKDERARLEAFYSKKHGDLDGLEDELDSLYRKTYPIPVKPGASEKLANRTGRTVLAEIFTGSGCPPCVAADLALEGAMEKYRKDELLVLMYHAHVPRPDPLAGPLTEARKEYYGIRSVPTMRFDGVKEIKGGGPRAISQQTFDRVDPIIRERLEAREEATLELRAQLNGNQVRVTGAISKMSRDAAKLKLHVVLVEEEVRYAGENGIRFHPMVVRSLAGKKGTGLPAAPGAFQHVFDLGRITQELKAYLDDYEINGRHGKITFSEKKHELNPKKLSVVAFLQDETDKAILQAAYAKAE